MTMSSKFSCHLNLILITVIIKNCLIYLPEVHLGLCEISLMEYFWEIFLDWLALCEWVLVFQRDLKSKTNLNLHKSSCELITETANILFDLTEKGFEDALENKVFHFPTNTWIGYGIPVVPYCFLHFKFQINGWFCPDIRKIKRFFDTYK